MACTKVTSAQEDIDVIASKLIRIMEICRDGGKICEQRASRGLQQILDGLAGEQPALLRKHNPPQTSCKKEIDSFIQGLKNDGIELEKSSFKRTLKDLIIPGISKSQNIEFDPKKTKTKKALIEWLESHWSTVREPFFVAYRHIASDKKETAYPTA